MQNKWEREEALRDIDYAKLEEMVERRFAGVGQARIILVDSMSQMSEAMLKAGEALQDLGKEYKERKWDTPFDEGNECTPVAMNPYQKRLPHTQNNNWRGNGKRGKRKST